MKKHEAQKEIDELKRQEKKIIESLKIIRSKILKKERKFNIQWVPICGYEDMYEISNYGDVRNKITGKIRKQSITESGYSRIGLYRNNKGEHCFVHRLVASHFIGVSDLQVNHKDSNKLNNFVDNLEYLSPRENINHCNKRIWKIDNNKLPVGVGKKGENQYQAKIWVKKKQVNLGTFKTAEEAGRAYKIVAKSIGEDKYV